MHIMHSLQSALNTYEAKEVLAPASFEGLRRSSSHESFVLQLRQQLLVELLSQEEDVSELDTYASAHPAQG
jgi:hypothetical protein